MSFFPPYLISLSLMKYIISTEVPLFFVIDGDISGVWLFICFWPLDQWTSLFLKEFTALGPRAEAI